MRQTGSGRSAKKLLRWSLWRWMGVLVGAVLVAFMLVLVLVVLPGLFIRQDVDRLTAEQRLKARNDVRTILVQALGGLALAGGLVVTYRTFQRNILEQDRTYELRQNEQVNEFFTRAVEQLGHEKAPVRLGALYSLEHLAQANPQQRQSVIDVFCSYLRMPFSPPPARDSTDGTARSDQADNDRQGQVQREEDQAQELQVRLTAQRRMGAHLHRPSGTSKEDAQRRKPSPADTFWPGISLDLAGATLVDFDLREASIVQASFNETTFVGNSRFNRSDFAHEVGFYGASFQGEAEFDGATFSHDVSFAAAKFEGGIFRTVRFDGTIFVTRVSFQRTTFSSQATFLGTRFGGSVNFHRAKFLYPASFDGASFLDGISFHRATFEVGPVGFKKATFVGEVWFGEAAISADLNMARVLDLDNPTRRLWPGRDWALVPDAGDATRGTLIDGSEFSSEEDARRAINREDP